jgi:hypothetical protein
MGPQMRQFPLIIAVVAGGALALASSRAHAFGTAREGFGIGIGSGTGATGVSGKLMAGPGAFQGVLGFWGHGDSSGPGPGQYSHLDGVALSLDYLYEMPSLAHTQYFNLDWSFGLGGGVGVSTNGGPPGVAVAGIAGLEFNFTKVPFDLTVEYRPAIGLLPDVGIGLIGFTAHLRVWF